MKENKKLFSLKTLIILTLVCGAALLYIFQHIVITKLGFQIRQDEIRLEKLINEKEKLLSSLSSLESPANIKKLVEDAGLNLELSKTPNVVRVKL